MTPEQIKTTKVVAWFLAAVGVAFALAFQALAAPEPPKVQAQPTVTTTVYKTQTKTIHETHTEKVEKPFPKVCLQIIPAQSEYTAAISAASAAAGKLDDAGDNLLLAMESGSRKKVTEVTEHYHQVNSDFTDATRAMLDAQAALAGAITRCSAAITS